MRRYRLQEAELYPVYKEQPALDIIPANLCLKIEGGRAIATKMAVGVAPIAAISLRLAAAALYPMS